MKTIWIIGAGFFGRLAADRLAATISHLHLVMVDLEKENLHEAKGPERTLIRADGARYLYENLSDSGVGHPDWIVPALPIHLAAEWCLLKMGREKLKRGEIPEEIDPLLPHPVRVPDGNIYVSHADFLCPDDCAEPRHLCTYTGDPRKENMFEVLEKIDFPPWNPLSIRSRQLGPGIGGYRPKTLFDLAGQIERTGGPILLSTACRCHGIMTGLHA